MVVKVLTIDDDPILRMVLAKTLKEQGYEVIAAVDGEQGVEQARAVKPDLIICDWSMPGMDGLEVCRHVKADPDLEQTFFILLTARSAVADRVVGLDMGADDFLTKPVDTSELLARVRAALRLLQANQNLKRLAIDLQHQKQILEAELAEAAGYVQSLLPVPMQGNVTINAKFLPSRQLGGDCFDYYWIDDDTLVLYLLDVSGHGLSAALLSISIQNWLRSQSLPREILVQPSQVLRILNDTFQMNKQNDQYFTIWYGVYHQSQRQLCYSSGGHPPSVLLSKLGGDINIQRLKTPGVAIGLFSDTEYVERYCLVEPQSTLYLFSDGIYEISQPQGRIWGFEQFVDLLSHQEKAGSDIDLVLEEICSLHDIESFEDDCSLLQVQFN